MRRKYHFWNAKLICGLRQAKLHNGPCFARYILTMCISCLSIKMKITAFYKLVCWGLNGVTYEIAHRHSINICLLLLLNYSLLPFLILTCYLIFTVLIFFISVRSEELSNHSEDEKSYFLGQIQLLSIYHVLYAGDSAVKKSSADKKPFPHKLPLQWRKTETNTISKKNTR